MMVEWSTPEILVSTSLHAPIYHTTVNSIFTVMWTWYLSFTNLGLGTAQKLFLFLKIKLCKQWKFLSRSFIRHKCHLNSHPYWKVLDNFTNKPYHGHTTLLFSSIFESWIKLNEKLFPLQIFINIQPYNLSSQLILESHIKHYFWVTLIYFKLYVTCRIWGLYVTC